MQVVLHGGEPLLAGRARLGRLITAAPGRMWPVCDLDLRVHTNGVLLNEEFCELFAEHDVKVGISIDGDRWPTIASAVRATGEAATTR